MGFEDLRMVDTIICQFLTAIRTCEDDGLTSDAEFRGEYKATVTLLSVRKVEGQERSLNTNLPRRILCAMVRSVVHGTRRLKAPTSKL